MLKWSLTCSNFQKCHEISIFHKYYLFKLNLYFSLTFYSLFCKFHPEPTQPFSPDSFEIQKQSLFQYYRLLTIGSIFIRQVKFFIDLTYWYWVNYDQMKVKSNIQTVLSEGTVFCNLMIWSCIESIKVPIKILPIQILN